MAKPLEVAVPHDKKDVRSGIIADIFTDGTRGQVLYEATAKPYIMLALVGNENSPRLTIGVAFNHYEFADPLGVRLTDSDWQGRAYDNPDELPPKNFWYRKLLVK